MGKARSVYTVVSAYIGLLIFFTITYHNVLFHWPNGIVVGNLIANMMWAPLAFLHLDRLARRHHREHMEAVKSVGAKWVVRMPRYHNFVNKVGQRIQTIDTELADELDKSSEWIRVK